MKVLWTGLQKRRNERATALRRQTGQFRTRQRTGSALIPHCTNQAGLVNLPVAGNER